MVRGQVRISLLKISAIVGTDCTPHFLHNGYKTQLHSSRFQTGGYTFFPSGFHRPLHKATTSVGIVEPLRRYLFPNMIDMPLVNLYNSFNTILNDLTHLHWKTNSISCVITKNELKKYSRLSSMLIFQIL